MTTLFISDLHLDPARPQITDLFGKFIENPTAIGTTRWESGRENHHLHEQYPRARCFSLILWEWLHDN
jgi:hypothetical protein